MARNSTNKWVLCASCGLALAFCGLPSSAAPIIPLSDGNSSALVDVGSSAGMFNWSIQGQNQLVQQWFWYRVGTNAEAPINTISAPTITTPNARSLTTTYNNGAFSMRVDYLMAGGAVVPVGQVATADISESITITNLTAEALDFHFFQYSDFDLAGVGNDTVQLGKNLQNLFNEGLQTDGVLLSISETATAPGANHGEAGLFPATLNKLNNGVADNLSDNAAAGPGDATWALQWDKVIAPGTSFLISKDKHLDVLIVPEPASIALLSASLLPLVIRRRKR